MKTTEKYCIAIMIMLGIIIGIMILPMLFLATVFVIGLRFWWPIWLVFIVGLLIFNIWLMYRRRK